MVLFHQIGIICLCAIIYTYIYTCHSVNKDTTRKIYTLSLLIAQFNYWFPGRILFDPDLYILRHVQYWSTIELGSSMLFAEYFIPIFFYVLSFSVVALWRFSLDTNKYMYMRFRYNITRQAIWISFDNGLPSNFNKIHKYKGDAHSVLLWDEMATQFLQLGICQEY